LSRKSAFSGSVFICISLAAVFFLEGMVLLVISPHL